MRSTAWLACAGLALSALLSPVARADVAHATTPCEELADFVARTGEDSGIGGTGHSAGGDDSGIGGTGIYGSITGFGSVCVNGLRVHHDAGTKIEVNGRNAGSESLGLGHVVWIHARARDGRMHAERLSVLSAAVGPVTAIDLPGRRLEIGRLTVQVPEEAILLDDRGRRREDLAAFAPGDSLDVSGLPTPDGTLVATRIERVTGERSRRYTAPALTELLRGAPDLSHVSIEGFLDVPAAGSVRIGGLDFKTARVPELRSGARVWLRGEIGAAGVLRADDVTPIADPSQPPESRLAPPRTPAARPGPQRLQSSDLPGLFDPEESDPVRLTPGGKLERAPGVQPVPMPPDPSTLEPARPGRAVPGTDSQTPKR